jgi:hypothetical protein
MKIRMLGLLLVAIVSGRALALSMELHAPDIFFPKSFDKEKGALIVAAISDKEFKFKEGLTSYWEPKFETMLAYDGDVKALNSLIARLSLIKGVKVEVTFSEDLSKETHGFPPAGNWWVTYDHTKPETVTVRVNLAAKGMERGQVKVPAGEKK